MKKKVAIIIERANIVLGGAERSVFELSMALGSLGYKVDILAAKGQTEATNIHILCSDVPGKRVGYFAFRKVLKKYLSENSYDIIHSVVPFDFADVYQPRGGTYVETILRNAASYQSGFFGWYKRVTSCFNFRRGLLACAERKLCKGENGPVIAALSNYVAEQLKRHYGTSEERIRVIANGVKTVKQTQTADADRLRTQILRQLRLREADEPIFFLFAANNFRLKGLRPLLEALRLSIAAHGAEYAYLIVAGSDSSYKYRHIAKKLGLSQRVLFLGTVRNMSNLFSITDVAVLPTFYDPSSRFILEALISEKPVITTSFNGASDSFVDGRHGKVVDRPDNCAALAEAIGYFSNSENRKRTSEAISADKIGEQISIMRVANELDAVYKSIPAKRTV